MSLKDVATGVWRKEIMGEKPKKILECPKCKTKVPSWCYGIKKCRYCGKEFEG